MNSLQPSLIEESPTYPLQDEIWSGESGQGYALRMCSGNGIGGLVQVKHMLGRNRFHTLSAEDAPRLAEWFGASVERLELALERIQEQRRVNGCSYMGNSLGRSYFLNRFYPRVCPDCLQESGYCRAAWDFSLAVACAMHKRLLIDCCPACARSLNWHRPGVGVCDCGYPWAAVDMPEEPTSWELTLAQWIDSRMDDGHRRTVASVKSVAQNCEVEYPLAPFMAGLSLDGLFRMTYALATAYSYTPDSQDHKRIRGALPKARQTIEWSGSIGLRLARREHLTLARRPSVLLDLLGEAATSANTGSPDCSSAQSLLEALLVHSPASRWTAKHSSLAQMVLF